MYESISPSGVVAPALAGADGAALAADGAAEGAAEAADGAALGAALVAALGDEPAPDEQAATARDAATARASRRAEVKRIKELLGKPRGSRTSGGSAVTRREPENSEAAARPGCGLGERSGRRVAISARSSSDLVLRTAGPRGTETAEGTSVGHGRRSMPSGSGSMQTQSFDSMWRR